ncbi:intercellular adhesion molecule 5 isoform X1 [Corythoichthys intestinalis]|uniref:intercellular adhesion molecule 5 isoform X1 n=1 Tax=Corythoichthys intestinalis TaxID=161448 RepID=UPI0025A5DB8D|nr:intercellular adhesion molecule 5 isoform X1 [Corythoichthys intestinalis]
MALGIFMLFIFWAVLQDAESECPVGHNPLNMTVSPSEVHYGENVTVSCASSVEDHDGIYFLDANGNILKRDWRNNSTLMFQVSDWDIQIHCKIKLKQHDASYECDRSLELTVYKYAKEVRLHQSLFKNGQKKIQCDIIDVAPAKEVTVTWFVDNLFFKSGDITDDQTKTPMNLSNSITVGEELTGCNITCSYQLNLHSIFDTYDDLTVAGPSFTDLEHQNYNLWLSCNIRNVRIQPVGWKESVGKLKASHFCFAGREGSEKMVEWALFAIEATPAQVARLPVCPLAHSYPKILKKSLDPASKRCNRNISHLDAYWKDGLNFLTAISEPLEKWSTKHQCHTLVSDSQMCFVLPPISFFRFPDQVRAYVDPDSGPIIAGNIYRLNCDIINVIAPENLTITWLRGDTIVNKTVIVDTTISPQNFSFPLDIWVSREEKGQIYTCQVEIGIKVRTLKSGSSPLNITVEPVRDLEQQGSYFSFFCDMDTQVFMSSDEDRVNYIESYLCAFTSYISNESVLFSLRNMQATSKRVGQLPVCPVAHSHSKILEESLDPASISCERNISRFWDALYEDSFTEGLVTVINEPLDKWSTKHQCYSDEKNLKKCYVLPPVVFFKGPDDVRAYVDPDSGPMLAGNTYRLNCDIINVTPPQKVTIMWLRGDTIVNKTVLADTTIIPQNISYPLTIQVDREENGQTYTCLTEMDDTIFFLDSVSRSDLNITVDYEPSFSCASKVGALVDTELKHPCVVEGKPPPVTTWFKDGKEVVAPHFLTRNSTGEYIIRATNRHGTATHMLYLDAYYAPTMLEDKLSLEFGPGDNLTVECSCDGNPAPNILWNYVSPTNVRTTGRRQELLQIIEAVPTNAGVYNCTATNMLGIVSKSITLIMKGESSADPESSTVPVAVILVCAFVLLVVLALICTCLNRKKHGRYSFQGLSYNIPLVTNASEREQYCNIDDTPT